MKKLRERILEIVEIAQECPEHLQQTCFEILLKHALGVEQPCVPPSSIHPEEERQQQKQEPTSIVEESAKTQEDISSGHIHVKVRRFLEKHDLSVDHLDQLFYKQQEQILPLYDDLKTTITAESQVRITLLQCLHNAMQSGEFQTSVEAVREEARTRKCYDKNNWGGNYTNNASLFDFAKYSRSVKTITVSDQGKAKLADVIKELQ